MALQVWLPLNKENELTSIGLKNNTFSKSSTPTYNSSGKIGGCYSFDGTDDSFYSVDDKTWWGGKEMYRVNYVAATRAKKILLWMEETTNKNKKKKSKWF